jgi:membrane-associated phospholipid phosphatase
LFIAERWQRPTWLAIGSAVSVILLLSILVAEYDAPTRLDRTADRLAWSTLDNPVFDRIDVYFQQLGDLSHLVVLVAVVTLALLAARWWSAALLVVLSTVLATAVTKLVLKPLVGRHYDDVLSFPSTHVTSVAAVALAVAVVMLSGRGPRRVWVQVSVACIAVATAVTSSVAVVAERTHYTTDTIAGWCVAVAVVLAVALTIDRVNVRRA